MDDRTGHDAVAFYLAYAHPVFMLSALALVLLALRAGLALRRARRLGVRRDGRSYARHLRLAKLAIALLPLGYAAGVASAVGLRGWDALGSAHGWVSSAALTLFLVAALVGRKLERGSGRLTATSGQRSARVTPDLHALLGVLAALCAAVALFTGFVLLP
jgi:hypothetical protein